MLQESASGRPKPKLRLHFLFPISHGAQGTFPAIEVRSLSLRFPLGVVNIVNCCVQKWSACCSRLHF